MFFYTDEVYEARDLARWMPEKENGEIVSLPGAAFKAWR